MQDFSSRNAWLFQVEMQGYIKLNVKIFKPKGCPKKNVTRS